MVSLIKRIVRWASVTRGGKDTEKYPVQQVIYLGKTADSIMVFPYGMHANVDSADLALMFAVSGDTDNRATLPTSMTRRSTLAAGDVEIYSPVSRSRVTIRANGDVEVDGANITATASGSITATAGTSATVTAPAIGLVGDVAITGNFSVSGTMTNAGKDVGATHGHTQGNDSGGNTEAAISGVT
jgi:phage baseplate assembly protein gpV